MSDEIISVEIVDGQVLISLPIGRVFDLIRFHGELVWTEDWWRRCVVPLVQDAMRDTLTKGVGYATGKDV